MPEREDLDEMPDYEVIDDSYTPDPDAVVATVYTGTNYTGASHPLKAGEHDLRETPVAAGIRSIKFAGVKNSGTIRSDSSYIWKARMWRVDRAKVESYNGNDMHDVKEDTAELDDNGKPWLWLHIGEAHKAGRIAPNRMRF